MKVMHLSDLHLGKRVNEFSMIDDQRYILKQVMDIVINDKADVVIIAGDVYDRQVPPVQAVELFDAFLTGLMNMNIPVLVISGNHDSAERIAFGSDIMSAGHIYMSRAYDGNCSVSHLKMNTDRLISICFLLSNLRMYGLILMKILKITMMLSVL